MLNSYELLRILHYNLRRKVAALEEETASKTLKRTVKNIMFTLYDEEEILRRHDKTVAEAAAKEAEQRGLQNSIQKLMSNLGWTQAQAMDALGIEQNEQDKYAAMMT